MTKILASSLLFLILFSSNGQNPEAMKIPMTPHKWQFSPNSVEFLKYKGQDAVKLLSDTNKLVLKDFDFSDGTIEFDVEFAESPFSGIYFRRHSDEEAEYFYLRTPRAGFPLAIDGVQYCPVIKGVPIWDMLPYYQAPAPMKKNEWNRVKLVVSGKQMVVYVNDMNRAVLQVPRLEGNFTVGDIAFGGKSTYANLTISRGKTEGLSPVEGFDPTHHDPRYLREWQVSKPLAFNSGRDIDNNDLPNSSTEWSKLSTERRGLVNLTRLYGPNKERRLVWIKTTIKSERDQTRRLNMGFSDEVWVIINGRLAYADKNWFGHPIMKEPEGRCSIENSSVMIPLKTGENNLLIGVTNFFYGWGIIARLDHLEGISF